MRSYIQRAPSVRQHFREWQALSSSNQLHDITHVASERLRLSSKDIIIHIKWTLIHPKTCRLPAAPPPHSKTAIPQLLDLKELMNLTSFEGMSLYQRLPTNPDPGTKRL